MSGKHNAIIFLSKQCSMNSQLIWELWPSTKSKRYWSFFKGLVWTSKMPWSHSKLKVSTVKPFGDIPIIQSWGTELSYHPHWGYVPLKITQDGSTVPDAPMHSTTVTFSRSPSWVTNWYLHRAGTITFACPMNVQSRGILYSETTSLHKFKNSQIKLG